MAHAVPAVSAATPVSVWAPCAWLTAVPDLPQLCLKNQKRPDAALNYRDSARP